MSILSPSVNVGAAGELWRLLTRHRQLAVEMTRRELTERFAGHSAGAVWAIGHPLITMAVYLFLFGVVFGQKVQARGIDLPVDFSVYMLSGLVPWLMIQEVMNKATGVIVGNSNLVKQVVFPVEILPVKIVLAALVTQGVLLGAFVIYILARFHGLPATALMLVPLILLQTCLAMGLAFALSAAACYLRDLRELIVVFSSIAIFLMPIVYQPGMVPAAFRPFLWINPFSSMVWCWQDALFFGRFEHPWAWAINALLSITTLIFGYRIFRKLKTYFGNVL